MHINETVRIKTLVLHTIIKDNGVTLLLKVLQQNSQVD